MIIEVAESKIPNQIIERVLSHGGDIVKFAGDAIIVYWKLKDNEVESEQNKAELVLKAGYCCMDLLSNLGTYEISIQGCPFSILRIHLGVGAGQIYDVHIGGESGRWEHFITGDAIRQLSTVLDLAKAGWYICFVRRR
jgi:class 3 adenylate cyclase